MNKTQIEMRAIIALEDVLTRSQYINPEVARNDKTPSWDGNIFVYDQPGTKKKDLLGKIDIQVKGHYNTEDFGERITYSVNSCDLKNFLNDSGVIYFVVYLKDFDNYKIYYSPLLRYDLTCLLKKAKDQKSKSIEMMVFPSDELEIRDIFTNFIRNRSLQGTVDHKLLSMEDVEKANLSIESFNFGYSGPGLNQCSPIEYTLNHPTYIYIKPFDFEVYLPVEKATFTRAIQTLSKDIKVNGELIYAEYDVLHTKEKSILRVGKNVEIDFSLNKIHFRDKGFLSDRIKDLGFFIAILENQDVSIGELSFLKNEVSVSEDFIKNALLKQENLVEIKALLEFLKIEEDLDLNNLTDKDNISLAILINTMLYNELLSGEIQDLPIVGNMKVGNLNIALVCIKMEDEKYRLYNYFDKTNPLKIFHEDDLNGFPMSPYIGMKKAEIIMYSNISCENIYQSIVETQGDNNYFFALNHFILELIDAYDESGKIEIYELALKILDWMIEKQLGADNIYLINKFQLLKRRRELSMEEIEILLQFKNEETDLMMLTAICILMDNLTEAKLYYMRLEEDMQESFKELPIYRLWEKPLVIKQVN